MKNDKEARRRRTTAELQEQLSNQIHLLQTYCVQFDGGDWLAALPIASSLRLLFFYTSRHTPTQTSLLAQLKLRELFWFDSARLIGAPGPEENWSWPQLLLMRMGDGTMGFEPKLLPPSMRMRRVSVQRWWTDELARHPDYGSMCRRDIVLSMADTDGGAHVDGEIGIRYDALKSGAYFNMALGNAQEPARGAIHASMRTIAHETLLTLHRYVPQAFAKAYTWKALGQDEVYST